MNRNSLSRQCAVYQVASLLITSALCCAIPNSIQAALVSIANPSFESPSLADGVFSFPSTPPSVIGGWTFSAAGSGIVNPNAAYYTVPVPDGSQVSYSNNSGAVISQVLGVNLTAGMTYTLQVDVGNRLGAAFPGYRLGLYAGGNQLAIDNTSVMPADNSFQTATLVFHAQSANLFLGQPLEIRMNSSGSGQINFDNVRLDASLATSPITVYTNRTAWQSALATFQTETFNSLAVTSPLAPNVTHTLGQVQFSYNGAPNGGYPGVSDTLSNVNGTRRFAGDIWDSAAGGGVTSPGPEQFTFPSPVTAFGADFAGATNADRLTVTVSGVTFQLDQYLANGTGFFGVVSNTAFDKILLNTENASSGAVDEAFGMDNLSFGTAPVPEPASLTLWSLGALGIVVLNRRR